MKPMPLTSTNVIIAGNAEIVTHGCVIAVLGKGAMITTSDQWQVLVPDNVVVGDGDIEQAARLTCEAFARWGLLRNLEGHKRVMGVVEELCGERGVIQISVRDLAALCAMTREWTTVMLQQLSKAGSVTRSGKQIKVCRHKKEDDGRA